MKGHLIFEKSGTVTLVKNHKDEYLGLIEYEKRWRCRVFCPVMDTMFSKDCLQEIITYMGQKS